MKLFLSLLLILSGNFAAQDTTKSLAHKINKPEIKYPLVKTVGRSYPLISGFALIKEANNGDPLAEHELGIRYLLGLGFQADTTKAIFWINKAAEKKLATAKYNLGIFALKGIGLDWNPFFAFKQFKETAETGFPPGQLAYGLSFIHDLVVNRNLDECYTWVKKSADGNFEPAKRILKNLLESGYTPPDSNLANITKKNDILSEDASAFNMDWNVDFIDFDSDTTTESTKSRVEKLFDLDKSEIKEVLLISNLEDSSSIKDTSKFGLINYAADVGGPEALMMRGIAYENGVFYKKNVVKALLNYLIAVRNGSGRAGLLIYELLQDENTMKVIESKANSGDSDAKYVWAGLIAFGYDYSILLDDALNLLEEAAGKGHIPSLIELGVLYYKGEVVPQDRALAYEYWEKADSLGSLEAGVRIAITRIFNKDFNSETLPEYISKIREARAKGVIIAETALGYCYENGIGVNIDKAHASDLYWNATSKGNEAGYISLKRMYDELRPQDEKFIIYDKNN